MNVPKPGLEPPAAPARGRPLAVLAAAAWLGLLVVSTVASLPVVVTGPLFVLLALAALLGPEGAWSLGAVARDAWACGVLGGCLFVFQALARSDAGVEAIGRQMVLGFLPVLVGLVISAVAGIRALAREARIESPGAAAGALSPRSLAAPALLLLLVTATLWSPSRGPVVSGPSTVSLLLHPPALLVVAGAALILLRVAGRGAAGARVSAPAIALAGTVSATAGLVQALLGFAARDISRVTAGISFLLTSVFAALVAMLVLAHPAASRDIAPGDVPLGSVLAWALFPLAGLLFLVLALVLAMTPMTAPG